ncbi:hypothetical protein [Algoriphagus sp.]|uniref:hypothetical protein n=1 Tax=Algoriphagus sp. TaxID=1872435 RepID=UPI0025DD6516|nr:hypothetical protein [Algoriphagus sp.]
MSQKEYSKRHLKTSLRLKEHLNLILYQDLQKFYDSIIYLRIRCSYSYPIAQGIENITVPILILPNLEIDYSQDNNVRIIDETIEKVIIEIKEWFKSNHILSRDGSLEFEITYFTSQSKIIDNPTKLSIQIQQISDLAKSSN